MARGDPDFTAFYAAATLVRSGQAADIYNPSAQFRAQARFTADPELRRGPLRYIHPPFEALLFVPFALFPYRAAFVLWDLANLGMLVAAAAILRATLLPDSGIHIWDLLLGLMAFFPIFANFFQGQDAILLLLLVALAFRAMKLRVDFLAGCWMALGLFRFQLVIPLVLVLVLWGRRRIALGFFCVTAVLILVSAAMVGWGTMLRYPGYLWLWASVPGFGRTPPSLLPSLLGIITGWPRLDRIHWLVPIVLILSAGLVILVARMKNLAQEPNFFNLCFACAILASLLAGYNTSTYDLALLVLPLAVMLREELTGRMPAYLLLPIVPLLISPLWFLIGMYWLNFNLIAIFLLWWLFAMRYELLRRRGTTPVPQAISPLA
ncbi:MAG: glycosyltransferase family 87 protein [Terriglobales bacterium]